MDKTQTGFISGRYIGHSTPLVYDIMHCTEKNNMDGLLMLIDFAKAYDSISWTFLYNVLKFLGFGQQFIKWIQLFNTNIKAAVLQCGFLSSFFNIKQSCRQGVHLSYFFSVAKFYQSSLQIKKLLNVLFLVQKNTKSLSLPTTPQ